MSFQRVVSEMMVAGALAGCARALDDRGGAPMPEAVESYMNQRLTVTGEIDEVRGEQAFILKHNDRTADEHLLVIATRPVRQVTMGDATVFRGEWVEVHAMVRQLSVPDMEYAYGFDLDPDLEVIYGSRPVLVTDWISAP